MNDLYLIKKETLTNIADNVRSLTGIEGEISLDTANNELVVAKENVEAVKDVLGSLGVEIPEGSSIGDLAGIIENNSGNLGGEDVTDETNAYTDKLSILETTITALEEELENKVSGGGSDAPNFSTCSILIINSSQNGIHISSGTVYDNNGLNYISTMVAPYENLEYHNIICNSVLFLPTITNLQLMGISLELSNASLLTTNGFTTIHIDAGPNETAIINLYGSQQGGG